MSVVGYARVSSVGQSLEVQTDKLQSFGCAKIFNEKASGLDGNREQLKQCLEYLREDDTLVITKLDRLARSTLDLCKIKDELEQKSVELVVIDQQIDTSTPTGKLLFTMLSAIAEFETNIRAERQSEGIKKARENGVAFGKKKQLSNEQVEGLKAKRAEGVLIKELMKEYGLSKASIYRYLKGDVS